MKKICFILVLFSSSLISAQNNCDNLPSNYTGYCYNYHVGQVISWIKEYKEGKATGIWMYFNEKGVLTKQLNTTSKRDSLDKIVLESLKRGYKEGFSDAGFESADSFGYPLVENDVAKNENDILTFVEEEAEFPGGLEKMKEWITKNLIYPAIAKEMGVQGRCYLKFVVEIDGQISNISVVKGVPDGSPCDKEAIRLLKSMPRWKPGKNNGKAVRQWCQVPIIFTLK